MDFSNYKNEIEQILNINQKLNYILNIESENIRLELIPYLSQDDYKQKVIDSFNSEELKIKGIYNLNYDYAKVKALKQIENTDLVINNIDMFSYDNSKVKVAENFSDNDKLKVLSHIKDDNYKYNLINSIIDENLKVNALNYLNREFYKAKVILTIKDEQKRFDLMSNLNEEDNKNIVIGSLNESLKIELLPILKKDSIKLNIILNIESENRRLDLISYLSQDVFKQKVIDSFNSEELKIKGIYNLEYDYAKVKALKQIKNTDLVINNINMFSYDDSKVKVAENFSDNDKLKVLSHIKDDSYKYNLINSIIDENLKVNALNYLNREFYKAKVILTIKDEQKRFDLISCLSDDNEIINIISSFKNTNLFYKALIKLKNEYQKVNVLINNNEDSIKFNFLNLILDEDNKAKIINSIRDINIKIELIKSLKEDSSKLIVINNIQDESLRIDMLNFLYTNESKFLVIANIKNMQLKNSNLEKINNYNQIMLDFFKKGLFQYLNFDNDILVKIFDDNQIKILKEYSQLQNEKLRRLFSNYVKLNYSELNINNIDKISEILSKIELSNSSELQSFGDIIAKQVLNSNNPLEQFSKIENIFVKNDIPYVGKIFEVFKLLHQNPISYRNYSPVLNRFKGNKHEMKIVDLIIFNDLLKCALGSNNRSLKEFINEIDKGNNILIKVEDGININELSNEEMTILNRYLDKIEIALDSYDMWKKEKNNNYTYNKNNLSLRVNLLLKRLNASHTDINKIPDIIIKKFSGLSEIDNFEKFKMSLELNKKEADIRNRKRSNYLFTLNEGDFVKGINDVKFLSRILQNGSVSKEFLGDASNSDLTPLDTDLSRILPSHLEKVSNPSLGNIISKTLSGTYGTAWIVLKNDPNRISITRDIDDTLKDYNINQGFNKLEAFKTLRAEHYGIRTGFPSSEISFIVSKGDFDKIGLEIAMNGFYIPVVDTNGSLVFSPNDYDKLREKMSGLSYYDETNYIFSDNLINNDTKVLATKIEKNNIDTKEKREKINKLIKEALQEIGLLLKDGIDGDLSSGTVELIDTGSTGRGTNELKDSDFDFMMRLDRQILSNFEKLNKLKNILLDKFKIKDKSQITSNGDFRLKNVNIDSETVVDIDITFTQKTDKMLYSTDLCLSDRLKTIKYQDPKKYNYVVANILLAKQILKEANAYKPNRGVAPQGGLGGVGIETLILQNGGSFIDAANNFLENAKDKTFEEFKQSYQIWDFGQNHLAERDAKYSHDNFVSSNMSKEGFENMKSALEKYILKNGLTQNFTQSQKR